MGKVTVLPAWPEHKEAFKCKRCGANLSRNVSMTTHKFGGWGIGAATVKVCKNCFNGSDFVY